jgi:hypothetical protein
LQEWPLLPSAGKFELFADDSAARDACLSRGIFEPAAKSSGRRTVIEFLICPDS